MPATPQRTSAMPPESHPGNSTSANATSGDLTADRNGLRAVTPAERVPPPPAVRCGDREAWTQAVSAARATLPVAGRLKADVVIDTAEQLAVHMGADGYVRVSAAALAGELGRARPTIVVALSRLVTLGYLIRDVTGGGRGRRTVYLATLPETVAAHPGEDARNCCGDPTNCCCRNSKTAQKVLLPQQYRAATPYRKNLNPPPTTHSTHQPPLPWQLEHVAGGGGTPGGDTTTPVGDALGAVIAKLPRHLARQLLADDRLPEIDGRVTAVAAQLPAATITAALADGLPNPTYDIAELILHRRRLPRLEAQARDERRDTAERHAGVVAAARVFGDAHARDCVVRDRDEFLEVLDARYRDNPAAHNAALAAYDDTRDAIDQEAG